MDFDFGLNGVHVSSQLCLHENVYLSSSLKYLDLHKVWAFSSCSPPGLFFCISFVLFLVVAKLYSHVVTDTAERSGLHLPIPDWVVKEADAIVEHPLHSETRRAEVIHSNISDVV